MSGTAAVGGASIADGTAVVGGAAVTGRPGVVAPAPYVGLRPYDEQDRSRFFGRGQDAERLINKIFSARLTLLYAPSAAGKTSLLRTLVIPDLREQDAEVVYFDNWAGGQPLEALVAAVGNTSPAIAGGPIAGGPIAGTPAAGAPVTDAGFRDTNLAGACSAASAASDRTLVLILDQFEEYLQRHAADGDPLPRQIAELVRSPLDVRLVLSFREEFLGALDARLRDFLPTLFASTFHLGHLDDEAVREAIVRPAEAIGLGYSNELLDRIIADLHAVPTARSSAANPPGVAGPRAAASPPAAATPQAAASAPGMATSLPMLQIVCRQLWEQAAPRLSPGKKLVLDTGVYRDTLGGRDGIVRRYLGEVTAGLRPRQLDDLAGLFTWLAPASGLKVAFPVDILSRQTGVPVRRLQALLDLLERRNIVRSRDAGGVTTYELFHDTFVGIVRPWSNERRAARTRKWRDRAIAAIVVLCLGGLYAAWGWYRNAEEKRAAELGTLRLEQQALAERVRNQARRGDTVRAIERSLQAATDRGWPVDAIALRDALSAHLYMRRLRGSNDSPLVGARFVPGRQVLTYAANGLVTLWDGETGNAVWSSRDEDLPSDEHLHGAVLSNDGSRVLGFGALAEPGAPASAGVPIEPGEPPGFLTLFQIGRPTPAWTATLPATTATARFSDDDRLIVATSDDGRFALFDAENGQRLPLESGPDGKRAAILAAALSPDTKLLATADHDGQVELLELPAGTPNGKRAALGDAVFDLAFTPDGRRLAVAGFRAPAPPLLEVQTLAPAAAAAGRRAASIAGVLPSAWQIVLSPDGRLLASIDDRRAVQLWSVRDGRLVAVLQPDGKAAPIAAAFDRDGRRLAVAYNDGWLRLWDTHSPQRALFEQQLDRTGIVAVAFSTRERMLVTATRGTDARVWSLDALPTVNDIEQMLARGDGAHRTASGLHLVARNDDPKGLAIVGADGNEISRLEISPEDRLIYGFSPDGRSIIVSGHAGNRAYPCARVWCAGDDEVLALAKSLFYERSDPER